MKYSRLDTLLLAGVGTLAVHEIAYLAGSALSTANGAGVSHGHIPLLWGLGGAVAVVALGRVVVTSLRSRTGSREVDPVMLSAAIAALYVSQEAAELAVSGSPSISLLAEPVLWLGLAFAPLVGIVLAQLVESIVHYATRQAQPKPEVHGTTQIFSGATPSRSQPVVVALAYSLSRRGPPLRTSK